MNLKLLAKKFAEEDIEWRIQQCAKTQNGYWALVVPYITNRAIMQRLDEACGVGNWKNEYKASPCNTGYMCGISIKIDNEWVTRWDGSEVTGGGQIDKVKSTLSTSMKRTGVQWGIGRYLYQFDVCFAEVKNVDNRRNVDAGFIYHENKKRNEKFQWKPPALEAWALPLTKIDIAKRLDLLESVKDMKELRYVWEDCYKVAISEGDDDVLKAFTKAKDESKKRIEDEIEAEAIKNLNEDTNNINNWVHKESSVFAKIVNEDALNSLHDSLQKKLAEKVKNTKVDLDQFSKIIKGYYQDQLTKLQGK